MLTDFQTKDNKKMTKKVLFLAVNSRISGSKKKLHENKEFAILRWIW